MSVFSQLPSSTAISFLEGNLNLIWIGRVKGPRRFLMNISKNDLTDLHQTL